MKRKKKVKLIPRQGPPVNVRPAGPHLTKRDRPRAVLVDEAICEQLGC